MANRSSRNSTLPRDIKKLVALSKAPNYYEKVSLVEVEAKDGTKVKRQVIHKDYENEIRSLFVEAHAHAKIARQAMLTQRSNVDVSTEEPVTEVSTT